MWRIGKRDILKYIVIKWLSKELDRMDKTLEYYNQNAKQFTSTTQTLEFSQIQDKFLNYLKSDAKILDFGCGAGRDAKYFLEHGYDVDASDGSVEMVKAASKLTGLDVKLLLFEDLNEKDMYDGIWACSSILHCKKGQLIIVFQKMADALKENGIVYTSFKYGNDSCERNGRYFTDFTSESFHDFMLKIPFALVEEWQSSDIRPGRENEKWLNLILRKN